MAAGGAALGAWLLLRRADRRIAAYQNKLLARQIDEVQNIYLMGSFTVTGPPSVSIRTAWPRASR